MSQTILIIDDFASVRLYHASFLARKGYRCLQASNGEEALAKLHEQPVDLVLLDMVMPGMSGGAFVARLATDARWATLPVLVITSEEALAKAAFRDSARPVSVLGKPVMPAALLQRVQQLLPLAAAAAAPAGSGP